MANATLWAHIYLVHDGYPLDPSSPEYKKSAIIYRRHSISPPSLCSTLHAHNVTQKPAVLNQYAPKPKLKGLKNLISGELEDDPELLKLVRIYPPSVLSHCGGIEVIRTVLVNSKTRLQCQK